MFAKLGKNIFLCVFFILKIVLYKSVDDPSRRRNILLKMHFSWPSYVYTIKYYVARSKIWLFKTQILPKLSMYHRPRAVHVLFYSIAIAITITNSVQIMYLLNPNYVNLANNFTTERFIWVAIFIRKRPTF